MHRGVAIVGIGQTFHKARRPDVNVGEMIKEAVDEALKDAQLTLKDIDAVLLSDMDLFEGDYLSDLMWGDYAGAYLKPSLKVNTGGTTGGSAVIAGWDHVASGLYDVVLTVTYQKLDSPIDSQSCMITVWDPTYDRDFATGAIGALCQMAQRYAAETGCPEEAVAMCRVRADQNALRNPNAHLKLSLTVEKVMNSRMVAYPMRLAHICPNSCGACALVLASAEKARKISNKPVWIKDHVTVHQESYTPICVIGPTPSPATQTVAAKKLYSRNSITNPARDTQVFEIYDPTSFQQLDWLEAYLICEKGEAWKKELKGFWDLEGEYPVNPSGGVVATNPIGATGMIRVAEAALQIRGDAGEHQVPREVKRALASIWGGTNWSILILLTKLLND